MIRKRMVCILSLRTSILKRYCSTKSDDKNTNVVDEKVTEKSKYNPQDKIKQILQLMIDENNQRGNQQFESKFPNKNKGFRRSQLSKNDDFKSDDSDDVKLKKAASAIAKSIGDNMEQVENDLLSKAMDLHKPIDVNWSELISGMKIETDDPKRHSRADEVKRLMKTSIKYPRSERSMEMKPAGMSYRTQQMEKVNLNDVSNLSIFDKIDQHTTGPELKMWNYLNENELRIAVTHPPSNYYQKMIMWTNQGKVWKFPIDNEQGMEEEQSVHFSEHVFLEPHLEGWCPTRGPIRHFMELVCVGLSKNHLYTVQEKIDHINWYKEYFGSKIELLHQTGSLLDGFPDKVNEITKGT